MTKKEKVIYRYADCDGDCKNCAKFKKRNPKDFVDVGYIIFSILYVIWAFSFVFGFYWLFWVLCTGWPEVLWEKILTIYFIVIIGPVLLLFCSGA